MAKRSALKSYQVNLHIVADASVLVSADSPENALVRGREIEASPGELFDDISEIVQVDAELTGVWCVD